MSVTVTHAIFRPAEPEKYRGRLTVRLEFEVSRPVAAFAVVSTALSDAGSAGIARVALGSRPGRKAAKSAVQRKRKP